MLFRKKCYYCKNKINKGKEIYKKVKDPVFTDKKERTFCCEEHAYNYEYEIENKKSCSKGCCG